MSQKSIAASSHIGLRTLERARFVQRYGIPELEALVASGELTCGEAEFVARWDADEQREHCAQGANHLRIMIRIVRLAFIEAEPQRSTPRAHLLVLLRRMTSDQQRRLVEFARSLLGES
jgi:hypothetical protein